MEIKDIPPFQPGDIAEIIMHDSEGEATALPLSPPVYITNTTRRLIKFIIGTGVSEMAGYGEYVYVSDGIIGNHLIKGAHLYLKKVDEIKIYPRNRE